MIKQAALACTQGAQRRPRAAAPRQLDLGQMESRVLFSATPMASGATVVQPDPAVDATSLTPQAVCLDAAVVDPSTYSTPSLLAPAGSPWEDVSRQLDDLEQLAAAASGEPATSLEVIFVDASVDDYDQLLEQLALEHDDSRQFLAYVLDPTTDGIGQISQVLSQHQGIDAIHLLSHGQNGAVRIGASWINTENIGEYAEEIASWGQSLSDTGDILVYGCNVAEDEAGQQFVSTLGMLAGADVTASMDATGADVWGGDWDLEYQSGAVETSGLFHTRLLDTWGHLLTAAPVVDLDSDDSAGAPGGDFATTWTEDGGPVLLADSDAVLTDLDSTILQSLTVTITNVQDGFYESLTADVTGTSIGAAYDSGTGVLTLSAPTPLAITRQSCAPCNTTMHCRIQKPPRASSHSWPAMARTPAMLPPSR